MPLTQPSHVETATRGKVSRQNLAADLAVETEAVVYYADFQEFLTELLNQFYQPGQRLVSAGIVTPDVQIAADRAQIPLVEALGDSPVESSVAAALENLTGPGDLVYVALPNRVTGASFKISELAQMARAVPEGLVVVDEQYPEFGEGTMLPLTQRFDNVVVMRTLTGEHHPLSTDAGFAVTPRPIKSLLVQSGPGSQLWERDFDLAEKAAACRGHDSGHVSWLRRESFRLARELSRIGVNCHLTPFGFLLIHTRDATIAGNRLIAEGIAVENLDGYPQVRGYLRYRIRTRDTNDHLVAALSRLPDDIVGRDTPDRRSRRLIRSGEGEKAAAHIGSVTESRLASTAPSRNRRRTHRLVKAAEGQ